MDSKVKLAQDFLEEVRQYFPQDIEEFTTEYGILENGDLIVRGNMSHGSESFKIQWVFSREKVDNG